MNSRESHRFGTTGETNVAISDTKIQAQNQFFKKLSPRIFFSMRFRLSFLKLSVRFDSGGVVAFYLCYGFHSEDLFYAMIHISPYGPIFRNESARRSRASSLPFELSFSKRGYRISVFCLKNSILHTRFAFSLNFRRVPHLGDNFGQREGRVHPYSPGGRRG
ncbi:hypothetical protein TRVL_08775 [Trypanosoma vivax]|nr:hypothetical protein TRVL_08775 [Trypanosoma vivax]